MPLVNVSTYKTPFLCSNPHVQTIFPSILRKVSGVEYKRIRIQTPDDDFLDLDLSSVGAERLVIVLHGLEGDSRRSYMLGMVKALNRRNWDVAAVNLRGCSGEPNKLPRMYHSGEIRDLETIITHFVGSGVDRVALVGFSLGGNVVLKYVGEQGDQILPAIKSAAAISVPCDLSACSDVLEENRNKLYLKRFLRLLRIKMEAKALMFPKLVSIEDYDRIETLKEFDDRYTAPLHGFVDANDYYQRCSCKAFLRSIAIPTLLINAADDPFLSPSCFPVKEAEVARNFFLEIPKHGGHVGFVSFGTEGEYWSESRAASFLEQATK